MRPPVIFARVVFAMLQEAIGKADAEDTIVVSVSRKAGFVLFSVSFSGHAVNDDSEVARLSSRGFVASSPDIYDPLSKAKIILARTPQG